MIAFYTVKGCDPDDLASESYIKRKFRYHAMEYYFKQLSQIMGGGEEN